MSTSFATAAISAMRANQPQYPASATVPRHTYSSSYARDYADIQRYNEYLKAHSDTQQSSRKAAKAEHEATNNRPTNDYNIVSNARKVPHEAVRAPYAQDDDAEVQRSASYQNPSRYVTSAQEAYIPPATNIISARLPPRPSQQTPPPTAAPAARVVTSAPWATLGENGNDRRTDSRDDLGGRMKRPPTATTTRPDANPIVPALPLGKVPKKAFEPYSVADDDYDQPEERQRQTRGEQQHSRTRDSRDYESEDHAYMQRQAREEAEREFNEKYGASPAQQQQQPRYEEDREDPQRYDEDFDRERDQFRASPDERAPAHFGKRVELEPRHQQQQQHSREASNRYGDEYDDADQVSQPMGHMRVNERDQGGDRGEGDRYRRQYQDAEDDEEEPRRGGSGYNQQRDAREDYRREDRYDDRRREEEDQDRAPYTAAANNNNAAPTTSYSRPGTTGSTSASRSSSSRPTYADQPAGRSSGLSMQSQRDRSHQPLWGVQPETERPKKKMVPGYEAYIEKASREPKKKTGGPAYDPQAAGARVTHTISRFGTDQDERAGEYTMRICAPGRGT